MLPFVNVAQSTPYEVPAVTVFCTRVSAWNALPNEEEVPLKEAVDGPDTGPVKLDFASVIAPYPDVYALFAIGTVIESKYAVAVLGALPTLPVLYRYT
jgi:hypothetical protein